MENQLNPEEEEELIYSQIKNYREFQDSLINLLESKTEIKSYELYIINDDWLNQWKKYSCYEEIKFNKNLKNKKKLNEIRLKSNANQFKPPNTIDISNLFLQNNNNNDSILNPNSNFHFISRNCFKTFNRKKNFIRKVFPFYGYNGKLIFTMKENIIIIYKNKNRLNLILLLFKSPSEQKNEIQKLFKVLIKADMDEFFNNINLDKNCERKDIFAYNVNMTFINKSYSYIKLEEEKFQKVISSLINSEKKMNSYLVSSEVHKLNMYLINDNFFSSFKNCLNYVNIMNQINIIEDNQNQNLINEMLKHYKSTDLSIEKKIINEENIIYYYFQKKSTGNYIKLYSKCNLISEELWNELIKFFPWEQEIKLEVYISSEYTVLIYNQNDFEIFDKENNHLFFHINNPQKCIDLVNEIINLGISYFFNKYNINIQDTSKAQFKLVNNLNQFLGVALNINSAQNSSEEFSKICHEQMDLELNMGYNIFNDIIEEENNDINNINNINPIGNEINIGMDILNNQNINNMNNPGEIDFTSNALNNVINQNNINQNNLVNDTNDIITNPINQPIQNFQNAPYDFQNNNSFNINSNSNNFNQQNFNDNSQMHSMNMNPINNLIGINYDNGFNNSNNNMLNNNQHNTFISNNINMDINNQSNLFGNFQMNNTINNNMNNNNMINNMINNNMNNMINNNMINNNMNNMINNNMINNNIIMPINNISIPDDILKSAFHCFFNCDKIINEIKILFPNQNNNMPLIHSLYATFIASNIYIALRELNEMINKLNTQNIKLEKPEDIFIFFIEKVNKELGGINQNEINIPFMPYNIENENSMYNDYLNQVFNKINTTFISQDYFGINEKYILCPLCKKYNYDFNIFYYLKFSIKKVNNYLVNKLGEYMNNPIKKKRTIQILNNNYEKLITLDDCFEYYFRTVSEDYKCSKCNKISAQAEKKNIIKKFPNVLCIIIEETEDYNISVLMQQKYKIENDIKNYELIRAIIYSNNDKKYYTISKGEVNPEYFLLDVNNYKSYSLSEGQKMGSPVMLLYKAIN